MQPICELIPSLFQPCAEQMGPQTAPVKPPRYKFHERSVILRHSQTRQLSGGVLTMQDE